MSERQDQRFGGLIYFQLILAVMALTPFFWGADTVWRWIYWAAIALLEALLIAEFLKRRAAGVSRHDESS